MKKGRYKRASLFYEKGELEKALKECELGISENLKDSAILNLKGIILYQKGLLNEAITCWNINREFNDDSIAKSYINDVQSDKALEDFYYRGEELLKSLNIEEALEKFKICQKSDFNCIKVNTAIALCNFKKGKFEESRFYIVKALKVDKDYESAKKLLRELDEIDGVRKVDNKKLLIATVVFSMILGGGYYLSNEFISEGKEKNALTTFEDKEENKNEEVKEKNEIEIDFSTLEEAISNKDVDKLYEMLKSVDKESFNKEEIVKIEKAEEIIKENGVENYYKVAQEHIKNKDNLKAYEEMSKAYEYGEDSYLYQHIIYFRAFLAKELSKVDEALKYYEEYIKLYDKEVYTEEALYNLALLNKEIDINKSKEYATKLIKDYPKSMYNNKVIKGIINGE